MEYEGTPRWRTTRLTHLFLLFCLSLFSRQIGTPTQSVEVARLTDTYGIYCNIIVLSAQHGIMSLNSVVNRLVRAAAGISQDISDVELDAHVAQLLAEEAKAKELKWSELGLTGLLGNSMAAGRDS